MIDRKAHWQRIYRDKPFSEVSWYQKEPGMSLALIRRSGIKRDEAIIDVGGGASVLVDFLCGQGYTSLSVLDIAEQALSGAKRRLGDLATGIEWIEADVTAFRSSPILMIRALPRNEKRSVATGLRNISWLIG